MIKLPHPDYILVTETNRHEQTVNAIVAMIAIMEQDLEIELSKKG